MTKREKLSAKFFGTPEPKDFTWKELVSMMSGYGFSVKQGDGARRKFYSPDRPGMPYLALHEPHPRKILKPYQVTDVKNFLNQNGIDK